MIRNIILGLSLFILNIHSVCAQSHISQKIAKVESNLLPDAEFIFADSPLIHFNIYDRMKFYGVSSISIAVINDGKIEWAKAYGMADENKKRMADVNTLYQAASITKPLNAFCIMKLVQDGKLSLDEDIRKYLKTWKFPDNDLSKNCVITLRNLLSHTAGLNVHGFKGYSKGELIPSINEMLDGKQPANNEAVIPVFKPNTRQEYSGGGTLITKKILEDNISANYDSLLKQTVLIPIGMRNSTFSQPLDSKWKNFAVAYEQNKKEVPGQYNIYPEQAPDGLWTTATDYAKFIISLQQSLKNEPSGLLNNVTAKEMLTPVLDGSDGALGVFVKEKGGEKYFFHEGANIGFRSGFYSSFSAGSGVVVLTNSDNGQALINEIVNGVATVYKWKQFYNPEVRKLVIIPDTLTDKYVGEYQVEKSNMKITIAKKDGGWELTARRPEKMYFISSKSFFLFSSPSQICEFTSADKVNTDGLVLKEGEKILFTAKKIQ